MASLVAYNISLTSSSPAFIYEPFRDGWYGLEGDPAGGWRASFSNLTVWPNVNSPSIENVGSGLPLRETYLDGANVTLNFEGTAIYLCLTPIGSSFTFTVDNTPVSTTGSASDPACADNGGQIMAYADGLTYGNHSATVRVNSEGATDFLFHGGVVTVGLNGTNPVVQRIDDTDPGWSYQPAGAWSFSNVSNNDAVGDYNTTRHWMCSYAPSSTASYTFNGSSAVQLLAMLNLNIGPYTIQLDGQSYVYNGSDLWRESQQVLFFKGALDPTEEYTITLVNWDQAVPNAAQPYSGTPCTTVDELILTKTTPADLPVGDSGNGTYPSTGSGNDTAPGTGSVGNGTYPGTGPGNNTHQGTGSGGSSPTGAIVGGVVGGISTLCIVAFLLWFFLWRRRGAQQKSSRMAEIYPMPNASMGEVTPYVVNNLTYMPVSTGDAMRSVQEQPKIKEYQEEGNPSSRTISIPYTIEAPATSRSVPRGAKSGLHDAHANQPSPAVSSPALDSPAPSASRAAASQGASSEGTYINGASTQELVTILNRRLRQEYRAENHDLDPPDYEPVD
ncbi:hypothetical protein CALVIDRAFT_128470 [Calocera viscosa TUFC12733]|uniref:Uncharacterized protein n=1 Tax=Calocera viscosa (strain TUFC12733) TaxID=1330018 RepID=A0A167RT48_CALVF|nr:hypothetical protein CALVIDRAFT_128470 [Calocera viscosa TUFC12733]